MSEELEIAQAAIVSLVGASFSGTQPEEAEAPVPKPEEVSAFDFDLEFQERVVYLAAFDSGFMRKVAHLLRPEYFESAVDQSFMIVALRHWEKYQCTMNEPTIMKHAIVDALNAKAIRKEVLDDIRTAVKRVVTERQKSRTEEIQGLNADYVADRVAAFVRQQAVIAAITRSVDLIDKGDYERIEKIVLDALAVGAEGEENGGDYFERLRLRSNERADESAGKKPPRGITTGHPKLDALLYHKGWGRKELVALLGGAKAGKTTALIEFASGAVVAGFNVLYVTLEVSNRIVEERADARFTETPISDLVGDFSVVNSKVEALNASGKCGRFYIAEFPSGTMKPAMLRSLLERQKAKGYVYDLVVVDYADIMAPDYRTNDPIENSKQVYIGLRAVAQEWDCAVLTATQSNREGYKSITAKAEHVSEDFNKVRTVDLMISINSTEEERKDGKARLYFAASRNQRSGMTIYIEQDFNRMKFIKVIERIE